MSAEHQNPLESVNLPKNASFSTDQDGEGGSVEPSQPQQAATFAFDQLSDGGKEVFIQHQGQIYRLRVTRNGRLILNK